MKLPRRQFLQLAAGAAALPAAAPLAWAQSYPTRPVHVIVPFAPGGDGDFVARLISQSLSERLGQQFVVENRPGAGTNIGTEAVVRAAPDGYTLLLCPLYEKLNFNFIRDIVPIASIMRAPFVMRSIRRFRPRRFRSSSPMGGPIRAKSAWRRRASGRGPTCPARCSRCWPGST
jgi:tripartite-type tricarboxylate transporter receptor subunit TctC